MQWEIPWERGWMASRWAARSVCYLEIPWERMEVSAMARTKEVKELRRIQKENKNDNINPNQ